MSRHVVLEARSERLVKALSNGDSQNYQWTIPVFGISSTLPYQDGVWGMGQGGELAPALLKLMPFGGSPKAKFSFRIYALDALGEPDAGPQKLVYIPILLAEFACQCGSPNLQGVPSQGGWQPNQRYLNDGQFLCDTMTLTRGTLGERGQILSTGPGSDFVAMAKIDMWGAKRVFFDFQQTDQTTMNVLWARA